MLNLTYTLLVKSGTHSLHLFSQLPLTCILSNAVYLDMSASIDHEIDPYQLRWNLVGLWPLPTGGGIKKKKNININIIIEKKGEREGGRETEREGEREGVV